jgi:hypothetical protein
MKINEDKTQAIYFSLRLRSPSEHLLESFPFKSESSSANIKLTLHKAFIDQISNGLCLPGVANSGRHLSLNIAAPARFSAPLEIL